MLSASRSAKLQSLQKMTEMQEFLEFIAEEGMLLFVIIKLLSCLSEDGIRYHTSNRLFL